MELTEDQRRIKRTFRDDFGYWTDALETLVRTDPTYLDRYLDLSQRAHGDGALSPKRREFVYIAVYCMPSNFEETMVRYHVQNALREGATFDEIAAIFKFVAAIGCHSFIEGAPVLAESLGRPIDMNEAERERREEIKADFVDKRGYWDDEMWDDISRLSIDWFADYLAFSDHLVNGMALDHREIELVAVAIDSSLSHSFELGLRNHVDAALEQGLSRDELVEIYEILTLVGISTVHEGLPILVEESGKLEDEGD